MASREVNIENTNVSGSDEITDLDPSVTVNSLVLLVRIEHVDGQPIESEVLTETTFKDLCAHTNPVHIPGAVEILSPHELCLTYKKGVGVGSNCWRIDGHQNMDGFSHPHHGSYHN